MKRSSKTISIVKTLGYTSGSCLTQCRCDELPCPLLTWLSTQLRSLCPELQGTGKLSNVFLVGELRNLLSDMFCPLTELISEVMEPSILNNVTEFLVTELQAAHIIKHKESQPVELLPEEESLKEQRVEVDSDDLSDCCHEEEADDASETDQRKAEMQAEWILLLHALSLDAFSEFEDVHNEVNLRLARLPGGEMENALLHTSLSSEQWEEVKKINQVLTENYQCRRQMMIKRFQVTLESFAWGEKQKERSSVLATVPPLSSLTESFQFSIPLMLAVREDQSFIHPIKAGKSTPIYKVLMGSVPDRGGRPGEIEPPMPMWGERRTQGNRGGGGQHYRQKKKKGKKE